MQPTILFSASRYKDSITKSTRGWKERLFARNIPTSDPSSEASREVDQGIATVSRMMDHLEIAGDERTNSPTASDDAEDNTSSDPTERQTIVSGSSPSLKQDDAQAPCAASSSH